MSCFIRIRPGASRVGSVAHGSGVTAPVRMGPHGANASDPAPPHGADRGGEGGARWWPSHPPDQSIDPLKILQISPKGDLA